MRLFKRYKDNSNENMKGYSVDYLLGTFIIIRFKLIQLESIIEYFNSIYKLFDTYFVFVSVYNTLCVVSFL